ncbi:MAG: (d)CMP kinase [bacterium]
MKGSVNGGTGIVVAIDGAAGTGKSSVAKKLATSLRWDYLETGALYRGVALLMDREGKDSKDIDSASSFAMEMEFESRYTNLGWKNFINGMDVTTLLRHEKISELASFISADAKVRSILLDYQRKYGKEKGVVLEGRDIGTVVFPDALLKFYFDADEEVRIKRRLKELKENNLGSNLENVSIQLKKRDDRDRTRADSPLKRSENSILVDTTDKSLEEVYEFVFNKVKKHLISG